MPTLCCIVSCSNKQRKGLNLSFFRIPALIKNEGPRAQELSERRRRLWFAAINREDASWKKVDGWRVCSTHFICGKPASLFDENNPDWVPTKNLGYERFGATSETDLVQSRYDRAKRRKGSGEAKGRACRARHDHKFPKVGFSNIAKNSFYSA